MPGSSIQQTLRDVLVLQHTSLPTAAQRDAACSSDDDQTDGEMERKASAAGGGAALDSLAFLGVFPAGIEHGYCVIPRRANGSHCKRRVAHIALETARVGLPVLAAWGHHRSTNTANPNTNNHKSTGLTYWPAVIQRFTGEFPGLTDLPDNIVSSFADFSLIEELSVSLPFYLCVDVKFTMDDTDSKRLRLIWAEPEGSSGLINSPPATGMHGATPGGRGDRSESTFRLLPNILPEVVSMKNYSIIEWNPSSTSHESETRRGPAATVVENPGASAPITADEIVFARAYKTRQFTVLTVSSAASIADAKKEALIDLQNKWRRLRTSLPVIHGVIPLTTVLQSPDRTHAITSASETGKRSTDNALNGTTSTGGVVASSARRRGQNPIDHTPSVVPQLQPNRSISQSSASEVRPRSFLDLSGVDDNLFVPVSAEELPPRRITPPRSRRSVADETTEPSSAGANTSPSRVAPDARKRPPSSGAVAMPRLQGVHSGSITTSTEIDRPATPQAHISDNHRTPSSSPPAVSVINTHHASTGTRTGTSHTAQNIDETHHHHRSSIRETNHNAAEIEPNRVQDDVEFTVESFLEMKQKMKDMEAALLHLIHSTTAPTPAHGEAAPSRNNIISEDEPEAMLDSAMDDVASPAPVARSGSAPEPTMDRGGRVSVSPRAVQPAAAALRKPTRNAPPTQQAPPPPPPAQQRVKLWKKAPSEDFPPNSYLYVDPSIRSNSPSEVQYRDPSPTTKKHLGISRVPPVRQAVISKPTGPLVLNDQLNDTAKTAIGLDAHYHRQVTSRQALKRATEDAQKHGLNWVRVQQQRHAELFRRDTRELDSSPILQRKRDLLAEAEKRSTSPLSTTGSRTPSVVSRDHSTNRRGSANRSPSPYTNERGASVSSDVKRKAVAHGTTNIRESYFRPPPPMTRTNSSAANSAVRGTVRVTGGGGGGGGGIIAALSDHPSVRRSISPDFDVAAPDDESKFVSRRTSQRDFTMHTLKKFSVQS